MFNYKIINFPNISINENIVKKIFQTVDKKIDFNQNGILNLIFVNSQEIKNLNKNYRKKDKITDILSFHYYDDFTNLNKNDIVGEIVFCEEKIISQGKEYSLGAEHEFYKLLIHSILHILGYDHELDKDYEIMQELENTIWEEVFKE